MISLTGAPASSVELHIFFFLGGGGGGVGVFLCRLCSPDDCSA